MKLHLLGQDMIDLGRWFVRRCNVIGRATLHGFDSIHF